MPGAVAPVVAEDYVVLVTDRNFVVVGDPIVGWTSLDVTLRFNEPGTAIMVVPAYPWIVDQFQPGHRMVIIRNGQTLIAGPWEKSLQEASDDGENAGVGKLTVHSTDDLALVVSRTVYPDPAADVDSQLVDNWTYTGNAEAALRALVNLNAGPGAITLRRIPQLALGAVASVGTAVSVTATRMQPLGEVARQIAEIGGGLGFRTRQVGNQALFEVYAPVNKSGLVRFSRGLGNLRYSSYERSAPNTTSVAVGGQGEGGDRAMIERVDAAAETLWGRFERMLPRPGLTDTADLQDDGDRALAEGAATVRVATNVADSPDQQFGSHYTLGDIVAVEPAVGVPIVELVRTVHLQVYATAGEYVSATVGSQAATSDPAWATRLREIDERLGRLERTVVPAA